MSLHLRAKNLSLTFKTRNSFFKTFTHEAVKEVSFDIEEGETLGVIGKNGCGKSTLLRILAGIVDPTSGTLEWYGNTRSLLSLGLGFRPDLSGDDNAMIALMFQGFSSASAKELLPGIKEFSELGDYFAQPLRSYSSGMRSRLAFATAISAEVDFILLDELLSVGDEEFKNKAEQAILDRLENKTVVFVSHSLAQVESLCDRAVWMEQGEVKSVGLPRDVLHEYKSFLKNG